MSERPDRRWVDGEAPDPEAETKRKRKRKREEDATEQDAARGPDSEDASGRSERDGRDDSEKASEEAERIPESEVRKIAAEAAFRRRIELAEFRESVGEEAYAELRERHGPDMRWYLEEGPLLLRAVVAETEPEDGPVGRIAVRYAVARETEPPPPAETVERVTAAFSEPAPENARGVTLETATRKAEALAREIPPEESVELVVDTTDRGPVFVSVDRATVEVHETASEDSPIAVKRDVEPPPTAAVEPATSEPAPASLEAAERIASEATAEPSPERPEPDRGLARTLEMIERAWVAERLPPIAGGSPELDEVGPPAANRPPAESHDVPKDPKETPLEIPEERREKPPERPPEPETTDEPSLSPAERGEPKRPRRRRSRTRMRVPEYHGRPAERMPPLPDADTRRRARKMLRKLAARFGLRLTPDLEGYLMQIVFRVRYMDGRLRRGIGVNIDILIRIMEALRSHYPLYSPKRRF
ncbi:MAG: hypothetical protein WD926_01905 [Patescibacteria group bacterium]